MTETQQKTLSQEYRDEEDFKRVCAMLMEWTVWQEARDTETKKDNESEED